MRNARPIAAMVLLPACLYSAAAGATVISFSGHLNATAKVMPDASCAPSPLRGQIMPANSMGTSPLGDFTYSHSICLSGGPGPSHGVFSIFFDDGQFDGTLTGLAVAVGDGTFSQTFDYIISGGTGRFAGGTGTFRATGTVDPRIPPPRISFDLAPTNAVPEPAAWATMLLGFAIVAATVRRRGIAGAVSLS